MADYTSRKQFEKFISGAPHGFSVDTHRDDSVWKGAYWVPEVQLAWVAWQEAITRVKLEQLHPQVRG
jgi:hypothetical protein